MKENYEKGSTLIINEKELMVIVVNKDERNNSDTDTIHHAINLLENTVVQILSYKGGDGVKEKSTSMTGNIEIIGGCREESEIENKSINVITHNMAFKYPLMSGTQPKSQNPIRMRNWTGYIFNYNNHQITTTTKLIIVEVNQDIGAETVKELSLKYAEIAQVHANNFAKEHNLTLGVPQIFRKPHFTITGTAIGQMLVKRGAFQKEGMDMSIETNGRQEG